MPQAAMHEPIHHLVRRGAAHWPGRVAIEWTRGGEERRLTYRELLDEAGRLAALLRAAGAARGDLAAVFAAASAEAIAGILAALEVGCAFVPLDVHFPAARLDAVVAEVHPRWWLVDPSLAPQAARVAADLGFAATLLPLAIDGGGAAASGAPRPAPADPAAAVDPDALAYVYFTSGSTGRPKPIAGRLKGIDHFIRWEIETFAVAEGWRVSQLTSPAFDAFLRDAFVPLAVGGTICVPPEREVVLDGARLAAWMDLARLDLMHCTPSVLRSLLSQPLGRARFPRLRHVLLAGETVLPADVRRWHDVFGGRIELVNLYGPTETTMTKLFYRIRPEDGASLAIPIGQAMNGCRAIVLDDQGQPCPPGKLGEIYIRTPYRSLGYLNRPQLTAESFVRNPLSDRPDDIVYRTGDLGRTRPDGAFEIVGRRDQQVKIRGVRVELAPIEEALRSHPAVADAAVVDRADVQGNRFLCAYVVLAREVESGELGGFLRERLAEAMVPSSFVRMAELPRTLGGKLNRRGLPQPEQADGRAGGAPLAPETPTEQRLCAIFAELLNLRQVSVLDSFFDLGGHSLLATLLLSRIRAAFAVEVSLGQLFRIATVRGLACEIARLERAAPAESEGAAQQPVRGGGPIARRSAAGASLPLSFGQERLWFVDQLEAGSGFLNIGAAVLLAGPLRPAALGRALAEVVRRHATLRAVFAPPAAGSTRPTWRALPVDVAAPVGLPLVDLAGLPAAAREDQTRRWLRRLAAAPFDLARGPLLRAALLRRGREEHVLAYVVHHIAADWWSLGVLAREATAIYAALLRGEPCPLLPPPLQYGDYAAWQRDALDERRLAAELDAWRSRLAGAPRFLPLPADLPRRRAQSFRGAETEIELPEELVAALRRVGRAQDCTLFMVVLALYAVLLNALTGATDLVVSAPVGGRDRGELEGLIGMFVNTLLLRVDLTGSPGFAALLARVREVATHAFEHRELPLERLIEDLAPERGLGYNPLLQASLNVIESDPLDGASLGGLALRRLDFDAPSGQFELNLVVLSTAAGSWARLQYRTDLFTAATAAGLLGRVRALFDLAVRRPAFDLGEAHEVLAAFAEQRLREARQAAERTAAGGLRGRRQAAAVTDLAPGGAEPAPERSAAAEAGR
jgi:amino acid adenylation domain-containing protein